MLDHSGATEDVVVKIDRHHQRLLIGAADGGRHRVDQGAINERAVVAFDRLENAGQGIGGPHTCDQRAAGDGYLRSGVPEVEPGGGSGASAADGICVLTGWEVGRSFL